MLSLALGSHGVEREFYTALKRFPLDDVALRGWAGAVLGASHLLRMALRFLSAIEPAAVSLSAASQDIVDMQRRANCGATQKF